MAETLYSEEVRTRLRTTYIIMAVIWVVIIFFFNFHTTRAAAILLLPLIVIGVGYCNLDSLTFELEDDMFKASFLSIGLILALPLLTWMSRDYKGSHNEFVASIIISLTFTLLTYIDLWIPRPWITVAKHVRSCMQTFSITLIVYTMVCYHSYRPESSLP